MHSVVPTAWLCVFAPSRSAKTSTRTVDYSRTYFNLFYVFLKMSLLAISFESYCIWCTNFYVVKLFVLTVRIYLSRAICTAKAWPTATSNLRTCCSMPMTQSRSLTLAWRHYSDTQDANAFSTGGVAPDLTWLLKWCRMKSTTQSQQTYGAVGLCWWLC